MSGYCGKCGEHPVDCKCNYISCHPPGTVFDLFCAVPEMIPIPDCVNHPAHYQGNTIEVIDIIEDFGLNFSLGNAIKYILRCEKKGRAKEDLQKAIWYLERELSNYE